MLGGAPVEHGAQGRQAQRATEVSSHVEETRRVACLFRRDRADRGLVQREHGQHLAHAAQDLREGELAPGALRRQMGVDQAADRQEQEAGSDQDAEIHPAHQRRQERHHQEGRQAADEHDHARLLGVVTGHARQELRQEIEHPVEHPAHSGDQHHHAGVTGIEQQAQVHHRLLAGEL